MTVPRLTLSKILTYRVVEIWECVQASVKLGLCDILFREALEHRVIDLFTVERRTTCQAACIR